MATAPKTSKTSPALTYRMTARPSGPLGLAEMVSPLAEVLAADDNPGATLLEIVALLVSQSRSIDDEVSRFLRNSTL